MGPQTATVAERSWESLTLMLQARGMVQEPVPQDGNCAYWATMVRVAGGAGTLGMEAADQEMMRRRRAVAEYMQSNPWLAEAHGDAPGASPAMRGVAAQQGHVAAMARLHERRTIVIDSSTLADEVRVIEAERPWEVARGRWSEINLDPSDSVLVWNGEEEGGHIDAAVRA